MPVYYNVPTVLHTAMIHAEPHGDLTGASLDEQLAQIASDKANISQTITDGVTDSAPSENAVADALDGKAPLASPHFTGNVGIGTTSPELS